MKTKKVIVKRQRSRTMKESQGRKHFNRKMRELDAEIGALTGSKEKYNNTQEKMSGIIANVKNAGLWKRFKYFFTGNVKTLVRN